MQLRNLLKGLPGGTFELLCIWGRYLYGPVWGFQVESIA